MEKIENYKTVRKLKTEVNAERYHVHTVEVSLEDISSPKTDVYIYTHTCTFPPPNFVNDSKFYM